MRGLKNAREESQKGAKRIPAELEPIEPELDTEKREVS